MNFSEVIEFLEAHADPEYAKGMARYNLPTDSLLGIRAAAANELVEKIGTDHGLALKLWLGPYRECRGVACRIADPAKVTEKLMEEWAARFDSWGICDVACGYLFCYAPFAWRKAVEWAGRDEEFVKRAAFSLMAGLAVNDKKAADKQFLPFLPVIKEHSGDERDFVKKAVNWALRQIGKRSPALNKAAIETAEEILELDTRSGRWIARDALRELRSDKVRKRLSTKK
jgi:3-methyladenine DNA glycosylase AlkD